MPSPFLRWTELCILISLLLCGCLNFLRCSFQFQLYCSLLSALCSFFFLNHDIPLSDLCHVVAGSFLFRISLCLWSAFLVPQTMIPSSCDVNSYSSKSGLFSTIFFLAGFSFLNRISIPVPIPISPFPLVLELCATVLLKGTDHLEQNIRLSSLLMKKECVLFFGFFVFVLQTFPGPHY